MESHPEGSTIRVAANAADTASLADWFAHEPSLRGLVSYGSDEPSSETMGAVEDIILHVVSPGVMGAIFGSLSVWLTQQRSDVDVTLKAGATEVTVNAKRVKDTPAVIVEAQQTFESVARHGPGAVPSPTHE
jgi:hypothetical protein